MTAVDDLVMRTKTAAFSRGSDGTITAWNDAATGILTVSPDDALGRPCHEVIAGRDVFGNDFCGTSCIPWRMAIAKRPIFPYRLTVNNENQGARDVRVVVIQARGATGTELVHFLQPAKLPYVSAVRDHPTKREEEPSRPAPTILTARELDIARLLHQGYSTGRIAVSMGISPTTVRNHISHCLHKLNAHSRIEAVAVARRLDLV